MSREVIDAIINTIREQQELAAIRCASFTSPGPPWYATRCREEAGHDGAHDYGSVEEARERWDQEMKITADDHARRGASYILGLLAEAGLTITRSSDQPPSHFGESETPQLGLATTDEMLTELSVRLDMTRYDDGYTATERDRILLAKVDIDRARAMLPDRTLAYRTVDQ